MHTLDMILSNELYTISEEIMTKKKSQPQQSFDKPLVTVLRPLTALANIALPLDSGGNIVLEQQMTEGSQVVICRVSIVMTNGRPRLRISQTNNVQMTLVN